MEAKDGVRQGDKGGWRGDERTCADDDSHRGSGTKRTMSHPTKAVTDVGLVSADGL